VIRWKHVCDWWGKSLFTHITLTLFYVLYHQSNWSILLILPSIQLWNLISSFISLFWISSQRIKINLQTTVDISHQVGISHILCICENVKVSILYSTSLWRIEREIFHSMWISVNNCYYLKELRSIYHSVHSRRTSHEFKYLNCRISMLLVCLDKEIVVYYILTHILTHQLNWYPWLIVCFIDITNRVW
jgi:hypothetical protein